MHWNGTLDTKYSTFNPIPELRPVNASLALLFLTADQILFSQPTDDAWFGPATKPVNIHRLKFSSLTNTTMFRQNEPGSPLGCKQREQYCAIGPDGQQKCTTLNAPVNAMDEVYDLVGKTDQEWMMWIIGGVFRTLKRTTQPLVILGPHALTARNKLNGPVLGSLPSNQWQLEIQHLHATSMAVIQATFLQNAIGFKDPKWERIIRRPRKTAEKELCENQVRPVLQCQSAKMPLRRTDLLITLYRRSLLRASSLSVFSA